MPVPANRENNLRNGFPVAIKPGGRLVWEGVTHPRWLLGTFARTLRRHGMPQGEDMDAHPVEGPHPAGRHTRKAGLDLPLPVRRLWTGALLVRGLRAAEDARRGREHGADAVILSNHGGRRAWQGPHHRPAHGEVLRNRALSGISAPSEIDGREIRRLATEGAA